jgi:hypothetical protein
MAPFGAMSIFRTTPLVLFAALTIAGLVPPPAFTAAAGGGAPPLESRSLSDSEKKFGIEILSLHSTAGGQMLDLRFRVVDPQKAGPVLDRNKKAYLLDGKTGKALPVPLTKAGSMRQTTRKPEAGRVYFMLFSNPGGLVTEGGRVSLIIGDFRKDNIPVDDSGKMPVPADAPPRKP